MGSKGKGTLVMSEERDMSSDSLLESKGDPTAVGEEGGSSSETASKAFDSILHKVGSYNYYQWKLMFFGGFCGLFTACHNMGAIFLAATPDHRCEIPFFSQRNLTLEKDALNYTVPWISGKDGTLQPSQCKYFDNDYSSFLSYFTRNLSLSSSSSTLSSLSVVLPTAINQSLPTKNEATCDSWIYDDSEYKSTVVTEWDLVCDKRWVMSSIQASYMMGILTGAVVFSAVSDKVGRRVASLICCCLFFLASVSASFVTGFHLFLALRFIVAAAGQGMFLVNFIIVMETVSLKGRNVMGNLFHLSFSIGFIILCVLGYFIRDWRVLQMVISVPSVILLSYYWLLPESPRWLLMQGREEEGLKILKSIAKANGRPFPSNEELKPLLTVIRDEVSTTEKKSLKEKIKSTLNIMVTLVRTPNMRRRNLIICYIWFVTSMIYYGLSFSGSNLKVSLYFTAGLSASVEIVSIFLTILLLLKFGRRTITSLSFFVGGAACIAIIFTPSDMVNLNLGLATFGKFNISSSFLLAFLLAAELMPTHVRNISIGMASMWARVGSGIAPFIVDLLGDIYFAIPSTIFGALSLIAGLLSLLLPETGNKRLPESIEEIESMPR